MSNGNFLKIFLFLNIVFLSLIASFIYFIDPFWTFSHSNKFNSIQYGSNEREQKSNLLYFKETNYDGLLLGSSRVTFLNQKDFKDINVFNYSFSLAMPEDYSKYIEFAKKQNKKDFEYIIIGLDFFGSNKNVEKNINPDDVFKNISSFGYKYKLLLSIDSLKVALENFKRSVLHNYGGRSYDRENIAYTTKIDENKVIEVVENTKVEEFIGNIKEYQFNDDLGKIFEQLKIENPNSKFIVFTTPTTKFYLDKLKELNLYEDYKKWLKTSVNSFDKVVHFMDYNSITTNYPKYFMDYHHIYPEYSELIINKIMNNKENIVEDFGKVLTKENLETYLGELN